MSQVIVDTSVWIDFFKGTLAKKHKEAIQALLDNEQVALTDIIKFEILAGARSQKEYDFLLDILQPLPELYVRREEAQLVCEFGFLLKSKGMLGKYTDVCIAYLSRSHDCLIWSFDSYFQLLSKKRMVRIILP